MNGTPVPPARRALRIALVTETFPPEVNGVAITVGRMLDGLLERGHQVHLVRPRQHAGDHPRREGTLREMLVAGIPLPRYAGLRMGLPATAAMVRAWTQWQPDIVHVVTEGLLGWSAVTAARRLHLPATSDFHTNFQSYSTHYGVGFLRTVISAYLRWFHNRSLCTFVPTQQLSAELTARNYRDTRVVARGVDTGLFNPQRRSVELRTRWGVAAHDPVVLYVGRIAPEKNLPLLLKSFAAMKRRDHRARLVLVGDGPARALLQRQHPDAVFAGMRTGEDLAVHYASGDLFLFPSTTETFGNVTLEAMASGLAVAAYDYAAAREHIVHGECGLLAAFADTKAFERIAVELVGDAARSSRLRNNARLAAEHIDWTGVNDAFAAALTYYATLPLRSPLRRQ